MTLKELGIEPSRDVIARIGNKDMAKNLTQDNAVRAEIGWELGDDSWYDEFEKWVRRYGGKITYTEEGI